MKGCTKFNRLVPEVLYGELDPGQKNWFESHLAECADCARLFAEMKSTLHVMDTRRRKEPSPEFWQDYWHNLETHLDHAPRTKPISDGWWRKVSTIFETQPRWAYQLGGAMALLLVGILIGKFYYGSRPITVQSTPSVELQSFAPSYLTVDERADRYIQRSKLLLLGLVNIDEGSDEQVDFDLTRQKQVSRQLVLEASFLKDELHDPDQQRIRSLVSDLELILLQLANLEADYDLPSIEMVKSAVDSRAILMRINLEEMRESSARVDAKKKSNEETI